MQNIFNGFTFQKYAFLQSQVTQHHQPGHSHCQKALFVIFIPEISVKCSLTFQNFKYICNTGPNTQACPRSFSQPCIFQKNLPYNLDCKSGPTLKIVLTF
ncbi:hypothetical protein ATANTOWER_008304 [Ataeniobius toweri]|uniref:Uncharacterized protein n=1 Tax=Ataeniobius toweri TaxID=208326 RepID=A0ABU7CG97_9TELE|nr:hypothetical protein [Ataeniobius toweri]